MPQKLIHIDGLVAALDSERKAQGLSWRQLAKAAGVSPSTLTRMQQGKSPDINTFSALTGWLNIPAERFNTEQPNRPTRKEDPMAVISTLSDGVAVRCRSARRECSHPVN